MLNLHKEKFIKDLAETISVVQNTSVDESMIIIDATINFVDEKDFKIDES